MSDPYAPDDLRARQRAAQLLAALGHPDRLRLLAAVVAGDGRGSVPMTRLADELSTSLAVIARDAATLAEAGLVSIIGHELSSSTGTLVTTADELVADLPIIRRLESEPELRRYFRHGRLPDLPTKATDRRRLAEVIIELIPADRLFSEAEINRILHDVMDDHAALRRFLVDQGLLVRSAARDYRRP